MIELFQQNFQLFLLVLVRILAMVQIAPLLSSSAIPQTARMGLSLFAAIAVLPWVAEMGYVIPGDFVQYALLILGEVLLGTIIGFLLVIIYATFQVAGQFFSLQMGFGASQVFDPLAQIEIPLMGQFLNVIGMLVFISVDGLRKFFLVGVLRSFQTVTAYNLVSARGYLFQLFLRSLGELFEISLTVSFPILGTLLLISITMGLLAKAAPQMNLLMMGFPIAIGAAFLLLFLSMPFLMAAFGRIVDASFDGVARTLRAMQGG